MPEKVLNPTQVTEQLGGRRSGSIARAAGAAEDDAAPQPGRHWRGATVINVAPENEF
jgi:hypothetical protein